MIIYNVKGVETLKKQGYKQDLSIIRKEVDVNASAKKKHKLTRENNQFLKSLGFTLPSKLKKVEKNE